MTFKNLLTGEKGKKILIIGAAAVLILLLLSSVLGGTKSSSAAREEKTLSTEDAAELEQALEARVKSLVESIDGAGTVNVMVTLDRSSTLVFDKDERLEQKGESGGSKGSVNRETETVLAGSAKEPLQTGVVLPKVRGAAVVCSGAGDPIVREKVTNAVAKALNIGISKVYVTN